MLTLIESSAASHRDCRHSTVKVVSGREPYTFDRPRLERSKNDSVMHRIRYKSSDMPCSLCASLTSSWRVLIRQKSRPCTVWKGNRCSLISWNLLRTSGSSKKNNPSSIRHTSDCARAISCAFAHMVGLNTSAGGRAKAATPPKTLGDDRKVPLANLVKLVEFASPATSISLQPRLEFDVHPYIALHEC
jgi:hypothetical protein